MRRWLFRFIVIGLVISFPMWLIGNPQFLVGVTIVCVILGAIMLSDDRS